MPTLSEAIAVKRRVEDRLLSLPGVHAVGFGGKVSNGSPTGEFSIRIKVVNKKPLSELQPEEIIPTEIEGVRTDVVESSPEVVPYSLTGGIQILPTKEADGLIVKVPGTLGCFAWTLDTPPKAVLLSNDHVLYGEQLRLQDGDPVNVDSCSGCCEKLIARLLRTGGNYKQNISIDAAIAELVPGVEWQPRVQGSHNSTTIKGTLDLRLENLPNLPQVIQDAISNHDFRVYKNGAKTDFTKGKIVDVDLSNFDETTTKLKHQLEILSLSGDDFSARGDSGSIIYDDEGRVVALLWGGSTEGQKPPKSTFGSHIKLVETKLQIRIATNSPTVSYRVGGEPKPHPALTNMYSDLSASGRQKEFVDLYGKHTKEVNHILRQSRRFIVAWHRYYGPRVVRSLVDLTEKRIGVLPTEFEDHTWADCLQNIADTLIAVGSPTLQADVLRYLPMVLHFGGRSYQEVLGFLITFDDVGDRLFSIRGEET
jgi:hypothetical protein